jgi:DNA helicase II / ATP-dependent DNA helicase PcrA
MIVLPPLTAEILDALGRELGGCDFTDPHQQAFLASLESCDVQAVPGNGKTTLLVAKLALLSRSWKDRHRGVCVVSHTNAARAEVVRLLQRHPTAFALLAYPHFVGTVTAFIDQFVAIPYLRGLGWPLRRIDDAAFEAAAKSLISTRPALNAASRRKGGEFQVSGWVGRLQLAENFATVANQIPNRLAVLGRMRQPGAHTNSGRELEEIKATLVGRGVYRYGDMMVLARRALAECPHLIDRLRARFPLILLDEAQDTHGEQLALLNRIFGKGAIFQRLGDQNQTLYEDPEVPPDQYWRPGDHVIPLDTTRRFGRDIAAFATRLTARISQNIVAADEREGHRLLLTFEPSSIERVLPSYSEWVAGHLPDGGRFSDVRAIASRHNLYRDTRGDWPKSLVDYHPRYRSGEGQGVEFGTFCGALRRLARGHEAGRAPRESHAALAAALVEYLEHHGFTPPAGARLTVSNLWKSLAILHRDLPTRVRHLVIEHILRSAAAWDADRWTAFCEALRTSLGLRLTTRATAYCQFNQQGADPEQDGGSNQIAFHHGIAVQLGSIHSVKGRTADAVLLVESEIWRGPAATQRVMDLATVLPHAFGIEQRNFYLNDAELAAATNVFVAVTRPRSMLALAIRRHALPQAVRDAAQAQGWIVRDLPSPIGEADREKPPCLVCQTLHSL